MYGIHRMPADGGMIACRLAVRLGFRTPLTWRSFLANTMIPSIELARRVALVTGDLIAGRTGELDRLFADIDSPSPTTCWDPPEAALGDEILSFLLRTWRAAAPAGGLPVSLSIDALGLRPALGYVMLLEPVEAGADFRYRVYGSKIAEHAGIEMTGKRVWDIPSPLVAVYFLATYRAVQQQGRALLARHTTHHDIQIAEWTRLILPFTAGDGTVDRLLVGNIPGVRRD